jgi:dienelactone hydrolase
MPPPRVVDLTATDGTTLKATYFAAGKPGPGILLLHQCNRQRKVWDNLAESLAASGLNVLTIDFRGFGESGGTPLEKLSPEEVAKEYAEKFPADVDTAFRYLVSQSGVMRDAVGAGGASCGVNQAVQLARRHSEVKSLVLLSETTDREGREFLRHAQRLPLFMAVADDDGDPWRGGTDAVVVQPFVQPRPISSTIIPSAGTGWKCSPPTKNCRA